MKSLVEGVGVLLREERLALGLTQARIGQKMGVGQSRVGKMERGQASLSALSEYAHELGLKLEINLVPK